MNARDFLEQLWGPDPPGLIQVWELASKRSGYYAAPAGVHVAGQADVYAAVGTTRNRLGPGRRATANQIAAIAGVFLDLDVGPDKTPTRTAALGLANAHVRPTITIDTGHGIHAYYLFTGGPWIFRSLDERAQAARLTRAWVALHQATARDRGWHVDPVGDLARLLRLPGTINAKDPDNPRPVTVIEHEGPRHMVERLQELTDAIPDTPAGVQPSQLELHVQARDLAELPVKVDALIFNDQTFRSTWEHRRGAGWSMSEYDLSLCSQAAQAGFTDQDLADLITAHRTRHGDPGKASRLDYLRRTISRARSAPPSPADELRAIARRAA